MAPSTLDTVELGLSLKTEYLEKSEARSETKSDCADLDHDADHPGLGLAPTDKGRDAWLVLCAVAVLEASVWGFPFAYGVFQAYYTTSPQFSYASEVSIAAVGTTALGIQFLLAPFMYPMLRKVPRLRKACSILGFVVLLAGIIGASFANTVPQLLATQGVVYAIGGTLHYYPVFLYLDEWWIARKGWAYGFVWAGGCTAGVAIPLVMQWLLKEYGFRTALRTWAVIAFVFTVPALFVLKPRMPPHHAAASPTKSDLSFLKGGAFWILFAGNVFQCLGYYMPSLYLPSFARDVGLSTLSGTIALALMNAANIGGAMLSGYMTDRFHVTTAVNFCAIGTLIAVFVFWTFAELRPMLFLFAILYGIFAGGFAATWAGVVEPVRKKYPATDTGMIVSLFLAGKGVASIVSGPLSGVLVRVDVWKGSAPYAYGSGYGYLILFTGLTAALSFVGWAGKRIGFV